MKRLILTTLLAAGLLTACGSDTGSTSADAGGLDAADGASTSDTATSDAAEDDSTSDEGDASSGGDAALAPPWDPSTPLGGDRHADVMLPDDYDRSRPWPLVVLLHGYTASASIQNAYFGLSGRVSERGFILVLPDGTVDASGNRFWNATDACCNFNASDVDDVEYLSGLVAEAKERLAVDANRVYFMGHSNGGFMSYRMACEMGSQISAIASLAGSTFDDAEDCAEDGQVGVLQIHGDADATVLYEGGQFVTNPYPGAREVAERWAARNGCDAQPEDGQALDLDQGLSGEESEVDKWVGCDEAHRVELWTIGGGAHIPTLSDGFTDRVLDFLWSHEG